VSEPLSNCSDHVDQVHVDRIAAALRMSCCAREETMFCVLLTQGPASNVNQEQQQMVIQLQQQNQLMSQQLAQLQAQSSTSQQALADLQGASSSPEWPVSPTGSALNAHFSAC